MAWRQCADDMSWCRQHMRMRRWHADDVQTTCRWCADDMHVTPGAVLHEIRQLRQEQLCIKPKMASLLLFSSLSHSCSGVLLWPRLLLLLYWETASALQGEITFHCLTIAISISVWNLFSLPQQSLWQVYDILIWPASTLKWCGHSERTKFCTSSQRATWCCWKCYFFWMPMLLLSPLLLDLDLECCCLPTSLSFLFANQPLLCPFGWHCSAALVRHLSISTAFHLVMNGAKFV